MKTKKSLLPSLNVSDTGATILMLFGFGVLALISVAAIVNEENKISNILSWWYPATIFSFLFLVAVVILIKNRKKVWELFDL